jgi:hypothetical protein
VGSRRFPGPTSVPTWVPRTHWEPEDITRALYRDGYVVVQYGLVTTRAAKSLVRGRMAYAGKRVGRKVRTSRVGDSYIVGWFEDSRSPKAPWLPKMRVTGDHPIELWRAHVESGAHLPATGVPRSGDGRA